MAAKDFGAIESDYAFFMTHATEAESDVAEYARELAGVAERRTAIRMLDFGCGTGSFSEQLLSTVNWPPRALELTLVEPVPHQCEEAALRLAGFSERAIATAQKLDAGVRGPFDVILSNHVLYYVDDLDATLRQLVDLRSPGGKLLLAMAGWDNMLLGLWQTGFAMLGRPVPYYAAQDVASALSRWGIPFRKARVPYRLRFPDSAENRLKILRFLFAEHLDTMPRQRLLGEFDRYCQHGHVEVNTHSDHFAVEQP